MRDRKDDRELIRGLLNRGAEKFEDGKLEPQTISDVVNLIKTDIALTASTGELSEMTAPRTIIREMTLREIMPDENGYDERLARRISETIVEYHKRPYAGEEGEPGYHPTGEEDTNE